MLGVLQNREGKYLITKRVMTKAWAAGWWEVSGGGVQAGESSIEAVRREVIEETGIDVSDFDGGLQFTYRRDNPDEKDNYFVDVYKFTGDFSEIDIRPQEAETDGFKLATLDEIKEYAEQESSFIMTASRKCLNKPGCLYQKQFEKHSIYANIVKIREESGEKAL